jgi:hypothetical protein
MNSRRGGKSFKSYDPQSFPTLDAIAKSHNILVWSKKLEDMLGISVSQKDSKPLRAFNALIKDISSNSIAAEILDATEFIGSRIRQRSA